MKDLRHHLTSSLGLGRIEADLGEAVLKRSPEMHGLGTYSGGNLPHGHDSAHARWLEDLKRLQEGFIAMELRAAKMKVQLAEFIEQHDEDGWTPDWENPLDRSSLKKELRAFHSAAGGVSMGRPLGRSSRRMLPKLTDETHHSMLVFHQGIIHGLNMKRVSFRDAQNHLLSKLQHLRSEDNVEGDASAVKPSRLYVDFYSVPKHVDGRKNYAVVRHINTKFRLDNINIQQVWEKTSTGWSYHSSVK
tara:strand:+ start:172 stop:909 length:738 start_codon:yes stop_codon:yes gene_type:complete